MRKIKMHLSGGTLPSTFAPLALVALCFVSQTGFARPKNQIVATIPLGGVPYNMVVSPDSKSVYVTNFVPTGSTGLVQVINTSTNTITATINLGSGPILSPDTMAVTPNGQTLYVADHFGPHLWVIDTATQHLTTTLALNQLRGLAVSPDGTKLYACNFLGGTVLVIDTATDEITNTIQIGHSHGHYPWDVLFTPDGSKAYIAAQPNRDSAGKKNHGYIAVVDTASQSKIGSILLTTGQGDAGFGAPMEVVNPSGRKIFYSQETSIPVISTSSNQVVRTIAQSFRHLEVAITPDGKFLYMVSAMGGETFNGVTTVAVASGRVVGKQIPFSEPYEVAVATNGKFAYVIANAGSEASIFVVDVSQQ